jgi:ABC-2 type transport system ATP-binding protein
MALTADHLIIIGRGKLLADTTVERFVRESGTGAVKVVSPEAGRLAELLAAPDVHITSETPGALDVRGTDAEHIGRTAAAHAIPLFELTPHSASLEQAFMDLTRDSVDYIASTSVPQPEGAAA